MHKYEIIIYWSNEDQVFIAEVPADATLPTAPSEPYIGLDHLGLRVDDVDAATAELKRRGAQVLVEPKSIRPGVRISSRWYRKTTR